MAYRRKRSYRKPAYRRRSRYGKRRNPMQRKVLAGIRMKYTTVFLP